MILPLGAQRPPAEATPRDLAPLQGLYRAPVPLARRFPIYRLGSGIPAALPGCPNRNHRQSARDNGRVLPALSGSGACRRLSNSPRLSAVEMAPSPGPCAEPPAAPLPPPCVSPLPLPPLAPCAGPPAAPLP